MGVVHRDLKPANMMITETGAVKIMDFGIARVAGTEHLTNVGFMMGTPAYMAPEQVRGEELDARADLYSMGVVFYRLTTAKLPFKGETPFAMAQSQVNDPPTPVGMVRPDLPPWVEPVVARSLAKRPEERFQSAAEFHEAFARCLAGLPFTTMYGATSNAQTEILATPPRPMPTGSLSMRGPSTGSLPIGSGPGVTPGVIAGPVMASGAHDALARGITRGAVAADSELMRMPAGVPATGALAAPAPTGAQPQPAAVTARKDTKTRTEAIALGAIALVILGLVGGGAYWYRSRLTRTIEPPPAAPAEPAPGGTATIDPTVVPPPTPATPDPLAPPAPGSVAAPISSTATPTAPPVAGTVPPGGKSSTTPPAPPAPGTTPAGAPTTTLGVPDGRGTKAPGTVPAPGTFRRPAVRPSRRYRPTIRSWRSRT